LFTFGGWERTGHKGHKEDTKDTKSDCLKSLQSTPQKAASGKLTRISSDAFFKSRNIFCLMKKFYGFCSHVLSFLTSHFQLNDTLR
jgi:hypothetical protein